MDRPDISIVIPVFNEEKRVAAALDDVLGYFKKRRDSWEAVFVDDGSADGTLDILWCARERGAPLRLVSLGRNRGKGEAIRMGVLASRGKYVLFRDADASVAMEEFERVRPFIAEGAPVIIGSRRVPGAAVVTRQAWRREFAGRCFTRLCRLLLAREVRDYTCGFKCFSREAADEIFSRQRLKRWAFDAEILFLAGKLGYPIVQVPVVWRDCAGTKVRVLRDAASSFVELGMLMAFRALGLYRPRGT